jgi:hypothetical protein
MDVNNSLKLDLNIINENEVFEGIMFSNIAYIIVSIDNENLLKNELFEGSFVYFDELKKSANNGGNFLIFTSISGIADDAGWNFINVLHEDNSIKWVFKRDDFKFSYLFDKNDYVQEVNYLANKIASLDKYLTLEPSHIVYPE